MKEIGLAAKVVRFHRAFARARIPHAFGGALALAYYATPRSTVDIDVNVFVSVDRYDSVAAVIAAQGADDVPPSAVAERDGQVRAWWGSTPVDLFFSCDEIHEAMRSAVRTVPFGNATIPILAPEHLLVAKVVFDRPKDWIDIEQILAALDDLDIEEIRRWLAHLVGRSDGRARRFAALVRQTRG